MSQILTGLFTSDTGSDANLNIGFVPDKIEFWEVEGTNGRYIVWFKRMEEDLAGGSQEGIYISGDAANRECALLGDGAGISAYESAAGGVRIPDPAGVRNTWITASPAVWVADTAPAAFRTVSVIGDVVWPTVRNGYVYEATVDGGGDHKTHATDEPTWPTVPGETVVDDLVTWTCRHESTINAGFRGVIVASEVFQNDKSVVFEATQADRSLNFGDLANA
ncbi:hypothetical protein LCGC14_1028540 [marine sediment metagenome]|uniref:Uncharacterized protein n=1 Tax=marine sediment metagenome TaxID=412755 RepID=A0A0F9NH27_9ZZZZ